LAGGPEPERNWLRVEEAGRSPRTGAGGGRRHCLLGDDGDSPGLRGYEDFYSDVALDPGLISAILDRVLERKLAYWEVALDLLGDFADVVKEADDFAGQRGLLISPRPTGGSSKPRQRELFDFIHAHTSARIFFHSCGAVRPIIPT